MSARMLMTIAAIFGLGMISRAPAAESDAPPARGHVFDRLDQNHDGVIQREEFEQAKARRDESRSSRRGDRQRFGRGERGRPRGIFTDDESLDPRIDEAIDRALERSGGDPEQLRKALHEELTNIVGRHRRAAPSDGPPSDESPGIGERRRPRAPDDGEETLRGRSGRGPGRPDGAAFGRMDPERRVAHIMKRLDQNNDGSLSADELGERGDRLMKADANRDDHVDASELLEFFRQMEEEGGRRGRGHPGGSDSPPPGNE